MTPPAMLSRGHQLADALPRGRIRLIRNNIFPNYYNNDVVMSIAAWPVLYLQQHTCY